MEPHNGFRVAHEVPSAERGGFRELGKLKMITEGARG